MLSTADNVKRAAFAAAFLLCACAAQPQPAPVAAPPMSAAPPPPAASEGAVVRMGALAVHEGQIVDQMGAPAMLRGMSLFWSQWMPQYYNADAVRWLTDDWGVNAVRAAIAVEPGGYLEHPAEEMRKAEAVIDAAIANGIYVIVDWHAHRPHAESAAAFFAAIAEKYGAYPNLIYEPWNEPLPRYSWAGVIKPYHEEVIAAIRAHDPDNLIVAGTGSWSQDVDDAAANPLAGENIAYTLHFYAGTHGQELRDKALAAMAAGAALMVTEWGTSEATGDVGPYEEDARLWWDFMEQHRISYLNWSVADKDEDSAALRPGASGSGAWPDDMLTPSGLFVRAQIRAMNAVDKGD